MPRRSRIELPGAIHHVTGKSPSRRLLFDDDDDRQLYLRLLAREIRERKWRLLTYCLLSNHLHLLIETPAPDLGLGMKRVHEEFGRRINRDRAECGHVFGARFYSGLVLTERHLLGCLRYIARNPVEAGICDHPRVWPWSGHRALAGLSEPPAFLDIDAAYQYLGSTDDAARLNYLRLTAKSDAALLGDLARAQPDGWLATARDDFNISVGEIATFLGVSHPTVYRRLATARENQGSVPSFSFATGGTVP